MDRVVPPIFEHIIGDEAKDIAPSDDPARDMLGIDQRARESMAAAMYQGMVETLTSTEPAASEIMQIGADRRPPRRRRAPSTLTGAPDGYVDPALLGERGARPRTAGSPLLRHPDRVRHAWRRSQLVVGAASTSRHALHDRPRDPADNSFVYSRS